MGGRYSVLPGEDLLLNAPSVTVQMREPTTTRAAALICAGGRGRGSVIVCTH